MFDLQASGTTMHEEAAKEETAERLTLKHMMTSGMKAMKSPMVTKIWLNGFKSRTRYA